MINDRRPPLPPGDYQVKVKNAEVIYAEAFPFPPVITHVVLTYSIPLREDDFEVVYELGVVCFD